jgi:hypothetical protein
MSKNLTRKGLTFGAIVALVSSVFAGAPAYAADELTLVPTGSDTTNYSTLSGETFTMMTGLAPATPAGNTVQLKYQVVTTSAVTVSITNGATVTAVATKNNVTQSVTNASVYEVNATVGALQRIALAAPTVVAGTPVTATVTAFFDANSDGMMTAGEFNSPARTITWLHADDVKGSVTVATVSAGDTTVTASATLTAINLGQIASLADFKILFRTNDATPGTIPGLATAAVAVERQTDGSLKATTGAITAVLKDATFRAVVVYKGDVVANALKSVTAGTITAVARTIATIDMVGVAATGLTNGTATQATASINGATPITVRTNASYSIVGTVKDSSATPVVVAGAKGTATLTVSGSAFSTSRYISVDGTNLAAGKSVDVTSGADGKFTLAIASAGLVAGDVMTFTVKIQNITNVVTVTYADAQFGIIDLADLANAGGRTILKGAAYKLDVRVLDQFGDAPSEKDFAFRVVNTLGGSSSGTYYSNIAADGTASFSFTDTNTAAATVNHVLTIQKSKDGFANSTSAAGTATVNVLVKNTADEVKASKVTVGQIVAGAGQASTSFSATGTQTGKANLSSLAFAAFDGRTAKTAAPALAKGYSTAPSFNTSTGVWTAGVDGAAGGAAITIPVSVNDSTLAAAAIDGAPVTITGKGSMFVVTSAGGKVVYGVDTLTFLADSASTNVSVMSTVTGVTSYVITSGTATATVKVDYTNYGTEASAIAMGTLPAQAQTGRTLGLSSVVTDKWGNVVANVPVSFSNTGVADVVSTATVLTDATGKANGKVTAGVNDIGTSFLVASFVVPAKTTTVSSAKSVEFGLTDGDVVSGGKRVFVNAEFAMGRTVTVTINGKRIYSKVQATDNAVELAFTQRRAGTYTVTVRISGGLTFTEKVSVR